LGIIVDCHRMAVAVATERFPLGGFVEVIACNKSICLKVYLSF